jgi:hypothetical protein
MTQTPQSETLTRALGLLLKSAHRYHELPATEHLPSISLRLLTRREQDEVERVYYGRLAEQREDEGEESLAAVFEAPLTALSWETLSRSIYALNGEVLPAVISGAALSLDSNIEKVAYLRDHLFPQMAPMVIDAMYKSYSQFYSRISQGLEEDWKLTEASDPEEERLLLKEQLAELQTRVDQLQARMSQQAALHAPLDAGDEGEGGASPLTATRVKELLMRAPEELVPKVAEIEEQGPPEPLAPEGTSPALSRPPRPLDPHEAMMLEQDRLFQERAAAGLPVSTQPPTSRIHPSAMASHNPEPSAAASAASDALRRLESPGRQPLNAAPIGPVVAGLLPSEGGAVPPSRGGGSAVPPSNPRYRPPGHEGDPK